ncbi:MAG: hypothetical protein MK212_17405 [Saprospiraceae bacterium]|nr:hypothetical protein [Saprospiraceae bacterium]
MKDSKLIILLKKYSLRKLNKFQEYTASPFFNKRPTLVKLCAYLLRLAPNFEDNYRLRKETIYKHIFPDKAFDKTAFNRLMSQLLSLFENFLVDYAWRDKTLDRQLLLLEELRLTKMDKHYQSVERKYHKLIDESPLEENYNAHIRHLFHKELNNKFITQGGRQYDHNLQQSSDFLDIYFLVEKLKIACDMANRNRVIKANYTCGLINELLQHLKQKEYSQTPIIQIYSSILQMQTQSSPEDEQYYIKLKNLLAEYALEFNKSELLSIYDYVLNFTIGQINKGQAHYYGESFSHYKFLVKNKIIFVDGYLPAWDYKNIVTTGLRLREFEWTKQFIEDYHIYLPPDVRKNAYIYNSAAYYLEVGNHTLALRTLYNVEFTDATYQFGAKIIQLKAYYELDESEALFSLISAFNNLLRRKKISEYWKQANLNCVKLCKRLFTLKEKKDYITNEKFQIECNKLSLELKNTSPLTNKPWLEECLSKLKN